MLEFVWTSRKLQAFSRTPRKSQSLKKVGNPDYRKINEKEENEWDTTDIQRRNSPEKKYTL